MKDKIKGALEVFSKSIVQPLMYLSVAGILLIIGILLTNSTITGMLPFLQSGPFQLIGKIVYDSLMFLVNNLSIIFCVGIAGAMAKKNKGHAALIGLMSFFLFLEANNITLSLTGALVDAGDSMLGLTGTGQSTVNGHPGARHGRVRRHYHWLHHRRDLQPASKTSSSPSRSPCSRACASRSSS